MDFKKNYDPKIREREIMSYWEKEKIYKFNPNKKGKIYSVDTPPPTVSGKMHVGHAFSFAQQDFFVRYHRMKGDNVFYPFGTDDNGLPTERLVEKMKNIKARDMPRDEFVKLCNETLDKELRKKYIEDWKRIGISCDWSIFYSTINEHSRRIAQWSFLDLHKKGRMERRDAPGMWCPECQTGIAQVELKDKELDSTFNDIVFKVDNKNLVISTTRPELLPACVAVFYNPKDSRYAKLKGKKAKVPLFNFEVPILSDERADPEKGTGIVMCCTFGDQTDMEWQKAHKLPIKEAIGKDGRMTDISYKYKGLSVKQARREITEDLRKENLLLNQKPIKHIVNVHERCGTEIEIIKSKQWFVRYLDLKKDMLKWGNKLNWHPEFMKSRYDNWVKGLQWDWLVSNQRFFGVPFPVWYCATCGEVILAKEEQIPVDPMKDKPTAKCKCGSSDFIPEKDVLNTWFTSSMTPQIAIQLMPKNLRKKLFPMSVRPQAHDIITFWLFNTVVKSQLHYGKNPFNDVTISGFVTLKGEKMSKSKGNIIEPQDVIEKYSSDSLRFWAAGSKLGDDMNYQEKDVVTGQKTVTKLWNASKFSVMHLEDYKETKVKLEAIDAWLLSRLQKVIKISTESFENYEYSKAKSEVENFFWNTFCDYYLEIVKDRLYNPDKRGKQARLSAQYTLKKSLFEILKLFAPFMPFVTEEIYLNYFRESGKEKSIHLTSWPKYDKNLQNKKADSVGDLFIEIISNIRKFKAENKTSLKAEIELTLDKKDKIKLKDLLEDLKAVASAKEISFSDKFNIRLLENGQETTA